jgi:hypothetical protein
MLVLRNNRLLRRIIFLNTRCQGDQIGRIFANGRVFALGRFTEVAHIFGLLFPRLRFDKNVLGYILGDFHHKLIWSPCSLFTNIGFQQRNSEGSYFIYNLYASVVRIFLKLGTMPRFINKKSINISNEISQIYTLLCFPYTILMLLEPMPFCSWGVYNVNFKKVMGLGLGSKI